MKLNDIATALRQLADQIEEAAGERKPAGQPPAETKAAAPVMLEQVRAAMTDLASAKGADSAKALLAEYGVKKLGDVPQNQYAALLTDAKAWAND